jgi:hypothetical protein
MKTNYCEELKKMVYELQSTLIDVLQINNSDIPEELLRPTNISKTAYALVQTRGITEKLDKIIVNNSIPF